MATPQSRRSASRSSQQPRRSPSSKGRTKKRNNNLSSPSPTPKASPSRTKSRSRTPKPKSKFVSQFSKQTPPPQQQKLQQPQLQEQQLNPNNMTKIQLRSYLSNNGCSDLPKPSAKKKVLIDLVNSLQLQLSQQATPPSPKPSNKRIVSCPSTPPPPQPHPSQTLTPSHRETMRIKVGNLTLLKDISPQYSDSPRSATSKLCKRIELHNNVVPNDCGLLSSKKQKLAKSIYFFIELATFLLALFSVILYVRWKFITPLPYCPSDGRLRPPLCLGVPLHATLKSDGSLSCIDGYQLKKNIISLGHSCVPDRRKLALMDQIITVIGKELSILAGEQICLQEMSEMISFPVLKDHISKSYPNAPFIRSNIDGLRFDDLFEASLEDCCRNGEKLFLQCTSNSIRSIRPLLPIGCKICLSIKRFYRRFFVHLWSFTFVVLLCTLLVWKRMKRLQRDRMVADLVRKVLHILAEQDHLNRRDPTIPSSISVPQIRDALFMKSALSYRDSLWPLVCRTIDRHSAVRESAMTMKGEQHRVWEWIGSDVLSPLLQG